MSDYVNKHVLSILHKVIFQSSRWYRIKLFLYEIYWFSASGFWFTVLPVSSNSEIILNTFIFNHMHAYVYFKVQRSA